MGGRSMSNILINGVEYTPVEKTDSSNKRADSSASGVVKVAAITAIAAIGLALIKAEEKRNKKWW